MSSLYNLEPQPTAKVLLLTTSGDISLELFAKQTPLASRNFLQLCLDGYYTDTLFHRLVPGYVLQGGDPTGTGMGGEAIYEGGLFADEFHSRLKFNRRGLLGMANSGTKKDDNGSQFFLTLAATPDLQDKNTMFGRVVGDTIYNLMKMGEMELQEGSERPLYPVRITGAEILVNPFEDMVKTIRAKKSGVLVDQGQAAAGRKKGKKKTGKTLLSFGENEDEAGGDIALPAVKKTKFNPKFADSEHAGRSSEGAKATTKQESKPKSIKRKASPPSESRPSPPPKLSRAPELPQNGRSKTQSPSPSSSRSSSPEPISKAERLLSKTNAEIASLKASMRRTVIIEEDKSKPKSFLESMIPSTAIRGRKRKANGAVAEVDQQKSLDMLSAFRKKLAAVPKDNSDQQISARDDKMLEQADANGSSKEQAGEDKDEEAVLCDLHFIANCQSCSNWNAQDRAEDEADVKGSGWMGHTLSFEKDRLGKDLNWKKRNEEDLIVIDPREREKEFSEKSKHSKKGAKAGR